MSDPYRLAEEHETPAPRTRVRRPVLWLLLVVSLAGNAAISTAGLNVTVGVVFGLIALACAAGLIVDHYRGRRR